MESCNTSILPSSPLFVCAPKKMSMKRSIHTSLKNTYMKNLILNKGVEFRIDKGQSNKVDCRDRMKGLLSGCPLNKETTVRERYRFELPMQ